MYRFLSYLELFGESWLSIDISVSVAASGFFFNSPSFLPDLFKAA